jgi:putative membrane protein insertion efficiency factor
MKLLRNALLFIIAFYRKSVSNVLPASCRYYPSCSRYAGEAIARYGAGRGSWLAIKRIARCHPWHPGGYDPVERPQGFVTTSITTEGYER